MIKFSDVLECDVLVDGGSTAGLIAAIYARENGASVIVAEKANTLRSGTTATGNDHFQCYIPEVHRTEEEWMGLYMHDRPGGQRKDKDLIQNLLKESLDIVKRWDEWGIPMRPHGYEIRKSNDIYPSKKIVRAASWLHGLFSFSTAYPSIPYQILEDIGIGCRTI